MGANRRQTAAHYSLRSRFVLYPSLVPHAANSVASIPSAQRDKYSGLGRRFRFRVASGTPHQLSTLLAFFLRHSIPLTRLPRVGLKKGLLHRGARRER